MVQYDNIPDYFFKKFCEIETYDIRQYITNKQTKFDLSKTQATRFPSWFLNFKYLRGEQMIGWALFAGSLVSLIFLFFSLGMSYDPLSSLYHAFWNAGGIMLALTILLGVILFPTLYLHSYFTYQKYNQTYLAKYIQVFKQMQQQGYIDKDLSKYPLTLQMAFYQRNKWRKLKQKQLKYYCSWFGLLSLEKFFYDYNKQQFPINMNLPFDDWFVYFCVNKSITIH